MDVGYSGGLEVGDESSALELQPPEDESVDSARRNERLQMQRIRELDMEQLEVEEADSDPLLSDNDDSRSSLFSSPHAWTGFYRSFEGSLGCPLSSPFRSVKVVFLGMVVTEMLALP